MTLEELIEAKNLREGAIVRPELGSRHPSYLTPGKAYSLVRQAGRLGVRDDVDEFIAGLSSSWVADPQGAMEGYGPWEKYLPGDNLPDGPLLLEEDSRRIIQRFARKLPERKSHFTAVRLKGDQAYFTALEPALEIRWDTEDGTVVPGSIQTKVVE